MSRPFATGLIAIVVVSGGCVAPWTPVGTVRLTVRAAIADRGVQAVVSPYSAASVDHVVLKAFEIKGSNEVAIGSAEVAKAALDGGATFEKLAPDTTYRVRAYAYKAAGNADGDKISTDEKSFVDVALGKEGTTATLTVKLADRSFDGQATGNLAITDGELTSIAPAALAFKPLTYTAAVAMSGSGADAAGGWVASGPTGDYFSYSYGFVSRSTGIFFNTGGTAIKAMALEPSGNLWFVQNATRKYLVGAGMAATMDSRAPTAMAFGGPSGGGLYTTLGHAVFSPSAGILAGNQTEAGNKDDAGAAARFSDPRDLDVAGDGTVYVADTGNNLIRKVAPDGSVTTVAGTDSTPAATVDGTGAAAKFNEPVAVALRSNGDLYVAEKAGKTIRRITPGGHVTTVSFPATGDTELVAPNDLAIDSAGYLRVADDKKTGKVVVVKVGPLP